MSPTKLGRYLLLKKLAAGGMAEIFLAKLVGAEGFEKEVVIKKILPEWNQDPEFIKMLVQEAKIVVGLSHPNIVQVYELGSEGGDYFIAMEAVQGMDLRQWIKIFKQKKEAIPLEVSLSIILEVLEGLGHAHERHVIHRDISPQNILISKEGNVKLVDFGIAKAAFRNQQTLTGVLKGKLTYMSPEQANLERLDERSDLFSVGIVFYELLTGEKLFNADSDLMVLEQVRRASVTFSEKAESIIPEALKEILSKSLERDPLKRFQDAKSFREAIVPFAKNNEIYLHREILIPYLEDFPPLNFDEVDFITKVTQPAVMKNKRSFKVQLTLAGVFVSLAFVFFISYFSSLWEKKEEKKGKTKEKIEKVSASLPKPSKVISEKTGRLHIQAIPWGFVTIDGTGPHLETPLKNLILKEGKHSLRVTYEPEGKELSSSIEIKADQQVFCLADFKEGHLQCH